MPGSLDDFGILRALIGFGPYEPKPTAPEWLARFATMASSDRGVLALLGPGGISSTTESDRRARAYFDAAALYLAALSNLLRGSSRSIAVGIPPGARHLPLLLAATAVLGRTVETALDQAPDRGSGVLVVSPDLDVRSRYCDLFVSSVQLDEAHPGSRLRRSGEKVPLSAHKTGAEADGVCFFLPPVSLPAKIDFRPALILLDLRYAKWPRRTADIVTWVRDVSRGAGLMCLYSLADTDTEGTLRGSSFLDLPLDHAALETLAAGVRQATIPDQKLTVDWWLVASRSFLARKHRIRAIPDANVIEKLFVEAGKLLDEHRRVSSPSLNRARWLQAVLTQVPVPLIWYEEAARSLGRSTLRRLIDRLGTESRFDTDRGPVIQSMRMLFDLIYRQMEHGNQRADTLKLLIAETAQRSGPEDAVLVLVRDRVVARALSNWFEIEVFRGAEWLSRVEVVDCSSYSDLATQRFRFGLINGAFPRRYRWIAGASLADEITFLTYDHEVQTVIGQLDQVYGEIQVKDRAARRRAAVSQFAPAAKGKYGDADAPNAPLLLELPPKRAKEKESKKRTAEVVLKGLDGLRDALEAARLAEEEARKREAVELLNPQPTWQEDSADESPPEEGFEIGHDDPHPDDVTCQVVDVNSRLHGKGVLLLPVDEPVECVRPSELEDIAMKTPRDLKIGDVILVVEEGGRSRLFDRIVELAENQPSLHYLQTHRHVWRQAIEQMASRYRSGTRVEYGPLLKALRDAGATVTSELAVRFWVDGQVIGPEARQSIIAVGRVSGVEVLVRKAKEFDRVFETIRSIRRGIGRRLSAAIRRSFKHAAEGEPEEIEGALDEHLGIAVDELIDTIDLAEVLQVHENVERVPPQVVGRFTVPRREAQ